MKVTKTLINRVMKMMTATNVPDQSRCSRNPNPISPARKAFVAGLYDGNQGETTKNPRLPEFYWVGYAVGKARTEVSVLKLVSQVTGQDVTQ